MRRSIFLAALLATSLTAPAALADPAKAQPGEPITRSELVVEADKAVTEWESGSLEYATQEELNALRSLLQSSSEEASSLIEREAQVREEAEQRQQRVKELRRPGF